MPPQKSTNPAARKRIRKRKRRAVSTSSESSASDSTSSDDEPPPKIVRAIAKRKGDSSDLESGSDSSDSSSSSTSSTVAASEQKQTENTPIAPEKPRRLRRSPSPSPPPVQIPSFLPTSGDTNAEDKEGELKERFKKFWMSSMADGFRDDLEELRKEPNLGTGRLALLIDSLASGADVFSSKTDDGISEMDVVMG